MGQDIIFREEDLYRQISLAINYSPPGAFIFIEANRPLERQGFPEKIKTQGILNPVYYMNINMDFPPNLPLHKTIEEWLKEKTHENTMPVLILDGFEMLFQDKRMAKEWLETFNFSREYLSSLDAVLVFIAPAFCMDLFRIYSPDLWAWRAFYFTMPQEQELTQKREIIPSMDMETPLLPQDNPEKRNARINILKNLLEEELKRHGSIESVWENILYPLSKELFVSGRYDESYKILKRAEKWIDSISETKEASEYFNHMGRIYHFQGNINSALKFFEQALKIDEKIFGKDHPNVARVLNNIAMVLQDKGDLEAALQYLNRALEINERVFEKDPHNVARVLNNIALILKDKGDPGTALQYLQKALEIDEKVFGKDHPNVGTLVNNIATVLMEKGDLEEAIKYFQRALEINEKAFGKDHPFVGSLVNNIAMVLKDKGDTEAALQYLYRALEINEKIFGKDHPNVATNVNNIALVLQDKGEIVPALQYLHRALEIDEKAFGKDHITVAFRSNNIATVLMAKGDLEGARSNLKRAYKIFLNSYGPENPSTKTALGNYISCGGKLEELEYESKFLTTGNTGSAGENI